MRNLAIAIAALSLMTTGSAGAAEVTFITYDLAGSDILVKEPIAPTEPGAFGGTLTIGFESVGGEPIVSGAVSISTLVISANPFNLVLITGSLLVDLTAPLTGGHLDPGNVLNGVGVTGVGELAGVLHCVFTAGTCAALGIPLTFTLSGPFPLSMGTIAFADFGSFTQVQPFAFQIGDPADPTSVVGTLNFVGTEISRTTVTEMPEPGSGALLLLAAVGLLGGGAWAARRAT